MSKETVLVNEPLQELSESGYEMAKGEPDIRGWKVINPNNQEIGKVKELLFDVRARKVRYLIVNMDGKPINLLSREIIIPVGLAELDEKEYVVLLPDVTVGHLASLPEYQKGKINYQTERLIRDVFIPQDSAAAEKLADIESQENPERETFYNNEYFDENRMYRRRKNEREADSKRYVSKDEMKDINEERHESDEVIYIADDKDPSVLRRAKVVRETPGDKN